jgi:predicted  nucleic acid-binding Zn-ribbon protein
LGAGLTQHRCRHCSKMRGVGVLTTVALVAPAIAESHNANPIRKVVTLLQNMEKKVSSEGEKERELFDKYMCYCKNGASALEKSIADAGNKIPELESAITEAEAKLVQLKEDVKTAQTERAAAKEAMATATAVRGKEKAAYDQELADAEANLAALNKAVDAISKGAGGAFLQTQTAQNLKKMVLNKENMNDGDRGELVAFLTDSDEYAPASGEIVGILKTMGDEMNADMADMKKTEADALTAYDALMAAKKKEVDALTKAIESKLKRIGELGVEIVQMKNDLGDTGEALLEDKKFVKDLEKNCAEKQKLFDENVKMRGQELAALQDTIKVLNDDDSLELFKKTLPGASSFLQEQVTQQDMANRAFSILSAAQKSARNPKLDFIALAVKGKKAGFEKVIKLIDDLTAELKKEQVDDESKKEYCEAQFDQAEDKKKAAEGTISDLEKAIADAEQGIITLKEEIDALGDGIRALDKSVTEATEQRQEEASDYTSLMASNTAAKQLLEFAKNRLNKFYNPKLYKAPPKRELSDEDRATLAAGGTLAPTEAPGGIQGTGVTVPVLAQADPGPAPEAPKEFKKKGAESNGIIAMIDLLIKDLDKEMTEAEFTEKDAQEDYKTFMADSSSKRAEDSKMLTDKEGTKADLQASLQENGAAKESAFKELMATEEYISSLHADCDWLIKYFDIRKEARTNEIDAMQKAKAVLSGADYSFLQVKKSFLRQ